MATLICYTGKYPHLGGVNTHLDILTYEMKKFPEVSTLFSNTVDRSDSGGNRNHSIWLLILSYIYRILFFGIRYTQKKGDYQKFVCHDYFSAFFLILIRKKQVIIVVHGELANELVAINSIKRGSVFYKLFSAFEKFIYKRASLVICVDSRIQQYILSLKICKNSVVLKNFISVDKLMEILVAATVKTEALQYPYLYCARRLVPKNGVIYLVKAYHQFLKNTGNVNIKLVIGGSGSELQSLKQYSAENKLDVVFLGDIGYETNIFYTAKAKINIIPSIPIGDYVEATAYSMLESLALKVPVLVSNVGGLGEVIKDNLNGFSFPPANFEMAAIKIEEILSKDPEVMTEIIERGFHSILNEHNAQSILEKYYI